MERLDQNPISIQDPEFARNLGFMSFREQSQINQATVAIAGAGGDGGYLAIQLARLGVGNFKIADPDIFEAENVNRQACATVENMGRNKSAVIAEYIKQINPKIKVDTYEEGLTEENAGEFVEGSNLVIDEIEFTLHHLGVVLARASRARNIPVLMAMNIGFGGTVTSFRPKGMTYEKFLGLSEKDDIEEIKNREVPLSRWLPYLPSYVDLGALKKVAVREKSAPSIAPGVAIAAGAAATQAFLHIVGSQNNRKRPIYAPHVLAIDPYEGTSKKVRFPRVSHYRSLMRIEAANRLNKSPKSSY